MKQLSLQEVEYLAHRFAKELMDFDEPIPPFATRFQGVLESCLAQPFQAFSGQDLYPGLADKAAALFYFVTKNHPFENGNKRMAVSITLLFLFTNGYWIEIEPITLYEVAILVAESKPKEKEETLQTLNQAFDKYIIKRSKYESKMNRSRNRK